MRSTSKSLDVQTIESRPKQFAKSMTALSDLSPVQVSELLVLVAAGCLADLTTLARAHESKDLKCGVTFVPAGPSATAALLSARDSANQ